MKLAQMFCTVSDMQADLVQQMMRRLAAAHRAG